MTPVGLEWFLGNKRIEGKSDGCEKTSFTGDVQATAHRNSFYTEKDFEEIAAAGLNTVKIPIGYWIVGFDNSGGGREKLINSPFL